MLVISRKLEEEIVFTTADGEIRVRLCGVESYGRARLGITAPPAVKVVRAELLPA